MTLRLTQLSYTLRHRSLIKEISASFESGTLYGILGPNGSGKSTLLKTMARIWNPTHGQLTWHNQNLLHFSRLEMSRTLSLVPQNPPLYFDVTAYQMVTMGRYAQGKHSSHHAHYIEEALQQVDAWHLRDQFLSQLSGGERQRIYIARALATQSPILLLDEPTSYLDLRHQLEIWQLLRTLTQRGKLVIVAVHDLLAVQRFCDQLIVLHQGRCQATGTYEAVMTPTLLQDIFGVKFKEQISSFELCL